MDPEQTLADLVEAALTGDSEHVRAYADGLVNWLDAGGFAPTSGALLVRVTALHERRLDPRPEAGRS